MSRIKYLDALDMEFQYYSCLIKDLFIIIPNRCEQHMVQCWFRKLSEPLYNTDTLRDKRNHYLLMLTISMTFDGLKFPFNKYPPGGVLEKLTCLQNPNKEQTYSKVLTNVTCDVQELAQLCDFHGNNCPKDTENIGEMLDKQFKFIIDLAKPHVCKLSNSDRRRASEWITFLSTIDSKCLHVKGVRNDYVMLLSGYLLNEELPGPFTQFPIDKIIPLEELVKIMYNNDHMNMNPLHPKTLQLFRDVPQPEEGAFAFIAISGDICKAFVRGE